LREKYAFEHPIAGEGRADTTEMASWSRPELLIAPVKN